MSIVKRNNNETEIDLLDVLKTLWKHIIWILAAGLVCGLLFYVGTHLLVAPTYRARITLYVNNRATEGSSTITSSDLTASTKLVDTYSAIIRSDTVMEAVGIQAEANMNAQKLKSLVSAKAVNNTEVFDVYVTDTDPQRAAAIANAIADIFPGLITEIVEGSSVKIVDRATVPRDRYAPSYKKNALMGFMLGAVAAAAVVLLINMLDDTIKSTVDFEQWDYPLLAVIPNLNENESNGYGYGYAAARSGKKGGKKG